MYKYKCFIERSFPTYILTDLQRTGLRRYNEFLKRELARPLLPYVEDKLHITLVDRGMSDPNYIMNTSTYRGELYIMSKEEVEIEIKDRVDKEVKRRLDSLITGAIHERFAFK